MFPHLLKISDPTWSAWRWLALVLLGFPLACDQTPTAPVSKPRPGVEASLWFPPVTFSVFDNSQYFPIDWNLAASLQYPGTTAKLYAQCGLFGWFATKISSYGYPVFAAPIDPSRAVHDQYGSGYTLGAVGVGGNDWRAVHWSALTHEVLPVMVIASDYLNDGSSLFGFPCGDPNVSAVQTGLANFESVLVTTYNWYQLRAGKTPRLLQPLVVFNRSSTFSIAAARWNALSAQGSSAPFYDGGTMLADLAWNAYATAYPPNSLGGSNDMAVRVLISVFTGNSPTVDGGTGWLPDMVGSTVVRAAFAVVPPMLSSLSCSWGTGGSGLLNNASCQEASYLVAHELGFTFGLQSCNYDLNCLRNTIMGYAEPPDATLDNSQINTLNASPFFF